MAKNCRIESCEESPDFTCSCETNNFICSRHLAAHVWKQELIII